MQNLWARLLSKGNSCLPQLHWDSMQDFKFGDKLDAAIITERHLVEGQVKYQFKISEKQVQHDCSKKQME